MHQSVVANHEFVLRRTDIELIPTSGSLEVIVTTLTENLRSVIALNGNVTHYQVALTLLKDTVRLSVVQ